MITDKSKVKPFENNQEYSDWQDKNCCNCKRYDFQNPKCNIDLAMSKALKIDGMIPKVYAERMGYNRLTGSVTKNCDVRKPLSPFDESEKIKRVFEIDPGQEELF